MDSTSISTIADLLEKMRHYYAMLLRVSLKRIQDVDGEEFKTEVEDGELF